MARQERRNTSAIAELVTTGTSYMCVLGLRSRGSRFLDFHFPTIGEVEKVFFFIFIYSYGEMSFSKEKITK
jgi:hypothetical protein